MRVSEEAGVRVARGHETTVEIAASVEEVWRALTDAEELSRWFAPVNRVKAGVGGWMTWDWGPGVVWTVAVEAWEPGRHLRLTEVRDRVMGGNGEPMEPRRLVIDFYVAGEKGKTVVRVVHSGFGNSTDWDGEYEGTRQGWPQVLLRLKLALERHRGERVHNLMMTVRAPGLELAEVLGRVRAAAPEMEVVLEGSLEFCGVMRERNGGVFGCSGVRVPGGSVVHWQVVLYGESDEGAEGFRKEWEGKLGELVGRGETGR